MAKDTKTIAEKGSASADERIYTIPLRSAWLKTPRNKRTKKSVNTIRLFLKRHMHSDVIKMSQSLNEALWYRGIEKPPGKIKVKARRNKEGIVWARLPTELDIEDKGDKSRIGKLKERVAGTPLEKKVEQMERAKERKESIKEKKEAVKEEPKQPLEKAAPKNEEKKEKIEDKKEDKPKDKPIKKK